MIWGPNDVESMPSNRRLIELNRARVAGIPVYYCPGGWRAIWIWLLLLVDLDVPLGFLICAVAPPRLVLEVPIRLVLRQTNATLCSASFSFMPELSHCLRSTTFDELVNAPPLIVSSSCQRRPLCPQGKMPQQFVVRMFASLECANFERSPLLTFKPAICLFFFLSCSV